MIDLVEDDKFQKSLLLLILVPTESFIYPFFVKVLRVNAKR